MAAPQFVAGNPAGTSKIENCLHLGPVSIVGIATPGTGAHQTTDESSIAKFTSSYSTFESAEARRSRWRECKASNVHRCWALRLPSLRVQLSAETFSPIAQGAPL
jgi:hypothetical protein